MSSKFHVFFAFHAISNIYKQKNWCKKKFGGVLNSGGGGGGGVEIFFFFRRIILSHFTFYAIVNIKKKYYWKVPLHLMVKWEVVSPNSR